MLSLLVGNAASKIGVHTFQKSHQLNWVDSRWIDHFTHNFVMQAIKCR